MKNLVYVDNSNIYIEARLLSAVRQTLHGGATTIEAMNRRVADPSWQLDDGAPVRVRVCRSRVDRNRDPVGLGAAG